MFLNIYLVKSVLPINMKGADCFVFSFEKGIISAVRDILYQLTSTGIECPWCGIENGISGA